MEAEAIALYRALTKHPELKSAQLVDVNDSVITVDSVWSQRCLEKSESQRFLQTYNLNSSDLKILSKLKPHLVSECLWNVLSPSGEKSVIVRKHSPDKNKPSDEKWFFEVWSKRGYCEKVFDVTSCEKHGMVYGEDGAFGSLCWNTAEDKLAYIAEKKRPKAVSYFADLKKDTDEKNKPIAGEKFLHTEDWGEMLVGKEQPVICVLDLTSGEVTIIEDERLADSSCGQVVWCPNENGVVFCALPHQKSRLGIIHCPVRLSILYHFSFETKTLRSLNSAENLSVRAPRFSPDGSKLAYLECRAGGAHCKCMKLKVLNWKTGESKVLIDVKRGRDSNAKFLGIYMASLPIRCWHPASSYIFLSTPCRSRKDIFAVNVETGHVQRMTEMMGCWSVKDLCAGYILAAVSTLDAPCRLAMGNLKEFDAGHQIEWQFLDSKNSVGNISWEVLKHKPLIPHPVFDSLTYESIILRSVDQQSRGLIMFPHGGPHSVFTSGYQIYFAFLVKLGFTIALVNYRGSTGFGEDSVDSLIGYIGDIDIKDVQQCAEEVLEKYELDRNKVVLLGGSHGGFIAAHLIGQYPEFYKAAVIRNPITNLVTKVALSDIPDWSHVEVAWDPYIPCTIPNKDLYSLLYSMSPVAHVSNVQCPTMVMLGEVDRRVPPSQGIEFYKALQAKGVPARLFVYPDNSHPIITIEAESDSIINLYAWFVTHLNK